MGRVAVGLKLFGVPAISAAIAEQTRARRVLHMQVKVVLVASVNDWAFVV